MNKIIFRLLVLQVTFLLYQTAQVYAQDFAYKDSVYVDYIKSVKFNIAGNPLALPAVPLGSEFPLELSFDDMDTHTREYTVSIIHCNKDWTPSQEINELEYLSGFNNAPIRDISISFNTVVNYMHYYMSLPNSEIGWKITGNYLLKVTDRDDDDKVLITRRFVVFQPLMTIVPAVTRTAEVSKSTTHQELDFEVQHKSFVIRSPRTELTATILQNKRWDTAIKDLIPVFIRSEGEVFDYQDKIVFEAGKEFRFFDMRCMHILGENVENARQVTNGYEVHLRKDRINTNVSYLYRKDLNGDFVVDCYDVDVNDCQTRGDYGNVYFTLKSDTELEGKDVYITGAISDWQIKPPFKMEYNESRGQYEAQILLKQGYYNYQYTTVDRKSGRRDDNELQGNWYETENSFTIILYYRGFGERYDQVLGYGVFDSRKY